MSDFIIQTCGTVAGVDHDHLDVQVYSWPTERDTNTAEGFEITAVFFEDEGCVMEQMTPEELASLESTIAGLLSSQAAEEAQCRADWAYDCWKDEQLEGRQ